MVSLAFEVVGCRGRGRRSPMIGRWQFFLRQLEHRVNQLLGAGRRRLEGGTAERRAPLLALLSVNRGSMRLIDGRKALRVLRIGH